MMKKAKLLLILLLAAFTVIGCTSGSEQVEPEDQASFRWEALNKDDLSKGVLTSLKFQIGAKFDDIIDAWGIPKDEDYMRGGKYYHYEFEDYHMFFFDPEVSSTVKHIQLNPKINISLNDIRELLGTPNFDEHDELSGNWVIGYNFDHYTLFVSSNANDPNSDVMYFFLKSEN